jgi:ketosteroid isomerase-like protein
LNESKVDIVRRFFEAIAARDVGAIKQVADPKVQLFAPRTGAETGQPFHLYLGHEGLDRYFDHVRAVWREFEFKPREHREREEYVVALGSLHSRGHTGPAGDDPGAWGFRFRGGRIEWVRAYLRTHEALRDVPMPNIDIVVRIWEANKKRDLETMATLISPSLEFDAPVTAGAIGKEDTTYRGREGLKQYLEDSERGFVELSGQVEHYWEVGNHVVALGHLRGQTRDGGEVDTPAQWAWRIENGVAVWVSQYTKVDEALRAVGLLDSG